MESELEKKTLEWSLAKNELRKLTEAAPKDISDMTEASRDYIRIRSLLVVVRSELVSSQESLSLSRKEMTDETLQFETTLCNINNTSILTESFC